MIVISQLIRAQAENLSADPSAGVKGRFWFNTATSLYKYDDGTNVRTVVNTNEAQTLTNKTIAGASNTLTIRDNEIDSEAATSGQLLTANGSGGASWATSASTPDSSQEISNLGLAASVSGGDLTVSLKGKDGNDPSGSNIVKVGIRSETVTSGVYVQASITAAETVTVVAAQGFGIADGVAFYLYVYLRTAAGSTYDLAISPTIYDEGSVQNGVSTANSFDDLYSNGSFTGRGIRLIGRLLCTRTAAAWTAPSEISVVPFAKQSVSEVVVDTGNGHGATSTKIRRFANTRVNTGSAITYSDDANTGGLFTVNETGYYAVTYQDLDTTTAKVFGISVNTASVTTNLSATTYANGKRASVTAPGGGNENSVSVVLYLSAGDLVRAHTQGTIDGTTENSGGVLFRITRLRGSYV